MLAGKLPRRQIELVRHPPDDDRRIRVTVEEVDQDFLPDARDMHGAKLVPGPTIGDADPRRGMFVVLAVAVPFELDFDAAKVVGPDFLILGTGDDGTLDALDARLCSGQRRAEDFIGRVGFKADVAGVALGAARLNANVFELQFGADDEEFPVEVVLVVVGDLVGTARGNAT